MGYRLISFNHRERRESLKRSLEDVVGQVLSSPFGQNRRNNHYLPYLVIERLRENREIGNWGTIRPVAEIVQNKLGKNKPFGPFFISPDSFSKLRQAIISDIKNETYKYFLPEGFIYLGKDTGIDPDMLSQFIRNQESYKDIIADPRIAAKKHWDARIIDLPWEVINSTIGFLNNKYDEDPDRVFKRYGDSAGTFYLIHDSDDLRAQDFRLQRFGHLIGNGGAVSRLTGIKDERFDKIWHPDIMFIRYSDALQLKNFLLEIYNRNKEEFFQLFGGFVGNLMPREFEERGIYLTKSSLTSTLGTPEKAAALLELDESEMKKRWSFSASVDHDLTKDLVLFMGKKFRENPEEFFSRYYSNELGVVEFARDYSQETNRDICLENISVILHGSKNLARVLNSEDIRLNKTSSAKRFDFWLSDLEEIIDFCKRKYEEDPKNFIKKYGAIDGIDTLKFDLLREITFRGNISPANLARIFKKEHHLARLMEVEDLSPAEGEWNQRYHTLTRRQQEFIYSFLKRKYRADREGFFRRYGSTIGVANLEDDLAEENVMVSGFRLSAVMLNSAFLQRNIGIRDSRFEREWHLRSIQINKQDRAIVRDTLKKAYEKDRLEFFIRYGSPVGQFLLQQDIKHSDGRTIPLSQLNTIVRGPSVVADLTGIPREDLKAYWDPRTIQLSERAVLSVKDYLKDLYSDSPDSFFEYFKGPEGMSYIIGRLKEDGKKVPNIDALTNLLKSRDLASLFVESDDPRFKEWSPQMINLNTSKALESTVDYLREQYNRNQTDFIERFGSPLGVINLAKDLKEKGFGTIPLTRFSSLVCKPNLVRYVLGVGESEIPDNSWKPVNFGIYLKDVKEVEQIRNHLKTEYEKDSAEFFSKYGGKVSKLILMAEMGARGIEHDIDVFNPFLSDGVKSAQLLGLKDERFEKLWNKKWTARLGTTKRSYEQVFEIMEEGLEEIVRDTSLPEKAEDRPVHYLSVRRIFRQTDLRNSNLLAELYLPEKAKEVIQAMKRQVESDCKDSAEITKLKDNSDIQTYGQERFAKTIGQLLYSFDQGVRSETQANLVRLFGKEIHRTPAIYRDPELWDYFSDYCLNYDMFHVSRRKETTSKSFINCAKNYINIIGNYRKIQRKEISLDAPLINVKSSRSKEDSSWHDIIG